MTYYSKELGCWVIDNGGTCAVLAQDTDPKYAPLEDVKAATREVIQEHPETLRRLGEE